MLNVVHSQKVQTIITCSSTQRQKKKLLHYSLELQDLAQWGKEEIIIKCHLLTRANATSYISLNDSKFIKKYKNKISDRVNIRKKMY